MEDWNEKEPTPDYRVLAAQVALLRYWVHRQRQRGSKTEREERMQLALALLTLSILMLVLIPVVLHFSDGDLSVNLKFWDIVLFLISVVALYGS